MRGNRPAGNPVLAAMLDALRQRVGPAEPSRADLLARQLLKMAIGGDLEAARLVLGYLNGQAAPVAAPQPPMVDGIDQFAMIRAAQRILDDGEQAG